MSATDANFAVKLEASCEQLTSSQKAHFLIFLQSFPFVVGSLLQKVVRPASHARSACHTLTTTRNIARASLGPSERGASSHL